MYVCVLCVCVCVFYSSINGCVGCYNILTTIYRVTMNTDKYPEGGFLHHRVVLCVIFWGTSILFSTVAALFALSPTVYKGSSFAVSLPTLVVICFFDDGHPDRHEWHLTVVLTCLSLQIKWNISDFNFFFFSCTCWSFVISSLEKCLFKSLAHFKLGY